MKATFMKRRSSHESFREPDLAAEPLAVLAEARRSRPRRLREAGEADRRRDARHVGAALTRRDEERAERGRLLRAKRLEDARDRARGHPGRSAARDPLLR